MALANIYYSTQLCCPVSKYGYDSSPVLEQLSTNAAQTPLDIPWTNNAAIPYLLQKAFIQLNGK